MVLLCQLQTQGPILNNHDVIICSSRLAEGKCCELCLEFGTFHCECRASFSSENGHVMCHSFFLSNDPVTPNHSVSENLVHKKINKKLVSFRSPGFPKMWAKTGVRKRLMFETVQRKSGVMLEASKDDSGHPVQHCLCSDGPTSLTQFHQKVTSSGTCKLNQEQ